jgi:acetyl/propionyl-CoA carboxylase alpha subunit
MGPQVRSILAGGRDRHGEVVVEQRVSHGMPVYVKPRGRGGGKGDQLLATNSRLHEGTRCCQRSSQAPSACV